MSLTREQAIALAESNFWKVMSYRERAVFQMNEDLLCMPFDIFHEAVEKTLGRPVYTHEFAFADNLRKELNGEQGAPTMEEIISLIPEDKRIIVVAKK